LPRRFLTWGVVSDVTTAVKVSLPHPFILIGGVYDSNTLYLAREQ